MSPNGHWQLPFPLFWASLLGPRDALLRTLEEGRAFLGHLVPEYDVSMRLMRTREVAPQLATPAVWEVRYRSRATEQELDLLVDVRTGAIVKRTKR